MASTLEVAAGTQFVLTARNAKQHGGEIVHVQPKTIRSLKTISGSELQRPARLSDRNAFQPIIDPTGFVRFQPDSNRKIGGFASAFVRSMIAVLPSDGRLPNVVRLTQRVRGRELARAKRPVVRMNGDQIVRVRDYPIIDWLRDLQVVIPVVRFPKSITVGSNATLVLDDSVSHVVCGDLLLHTGARILVRNPHTTIDVVGKMQGDLP